MRIAVIGAGRMGAIRAEDLMADPRVDEVLIANRDDSRAAALAARLGATPVPWASMSDVGADATIVSLATDAHAGILASVLRAGRPTLCEKPIALTLEATERAMAEARDHGTTLQVGFQRRFDPGIQAMQACMAAGDLGVIYSISLLSHDIAPSGPEFIAGSGGIFRDLHVHDFDILRWLSDSEIDTVYATAAVRAHHEYAHFDDADVAVIHLTTTSGVQAVVRGARHDALGHDVRIEAHGSLDSLSAGLTSRTPLRTLDGGLGTNADAYMGFVDRFREAFRRETAAFVSVVAGAASNPCPPEAALESLRVAIACEQSITSGGPVRVAEVGSQKS